MSEFPDEIWIWPQYRTWYDRKFTGIKRVAELEKANMEKENKILQIKNAGTLANNLCPDHRDKQAGESCLACEIERLLCGGPMEDIECPWPVEIWPMTDKEYATAIPDKSLRTAISGFLMRCGWDIAVKMLAKEVAYCKSCFELNPCGSAIKRQDEAALTSCSGTMEDEPWKDRYASLEIRMDDLKKRFNEQCDINATLCRYMYRDG